jgi:hypothetical protein
MTLTQIDIETRLFTASELANALGVHRAFVTRMKQAGFAMPGNRSTVRWALDWLRANPHFTATVPDAITPTPILPPNTPPGWAGSFTSTAHGGASASPSGPSTAHH